MLPEILIPVLVAAVIGSGAGTFTGLVPGIHVNTLATMMLASYPAVEPLLEGVCGADNVPIVAASFIMSASIVHSFVDFIPSVFLGAPDADEALTVLPGHRLLMAGRGMEAVKSAAAGSVIGACASLGLAIPIQYLMVNGLEGIMEQFTTMVLLFTLVIIIVNERSLSRMGWACILVALSGWLGILCNDESIRCSGILGDGTLLFPLLTGLFGMPAMLESTGNASIPKQDDCKEFDVGSGPGIKGALIGGIVGWYPGITATAGASLASAFLPEKDPARFISLTASIGTVTSVFAIVALSVSGSGRSGTSMAVKEIVSDNLEGFCSDWFVLLLISMTAATFLGYIITLKAGRRMADLVGAVDMGRLNMIVAVFVTALVILLTGPVGLAVLGVSTLVGFIPLRTGTDRVPLAGCLMIPILLG